MTDEEILRERDAAVITYIRLEEHIKALWRSYDGPLTYGEFALAEIDKLTGGK
jgi:hypothetical protein